MSRTILNKVKHVTLRVTQSERDELRRRARGRSLSAYIRGRVFGRQSRAPMQRLEQKTLGKLSQIGDLVSDYAHYVETHPTLKRGEIIDFLGNVENELHAVRFSILQNEAGDGDC